MIISLILLSVVLLSVSTAFAISDDDNITLNEVDDEIPIDEDVLAVEEDSLTLEKNDEAVLKEDASDEIVSASAVVTNATFSNYFDDTGALLDNVTADELVFEGDFSGVAAYISIDKPIKFTGKNATFDGTSFMINSDNVTIDGFTITQSDVYGIYLDAVDGVTLSNNIIKFTALEGYDSYAIYAVTVDNLKLINNNITYVGVTTGTKTNNVIRIEGEVDIDTMYDEVVDVTPSTNIVIEGNVFNITMPSTDVYYDWATFNAYPYSDGLVFLTCENLSFTDNTIDMQYKNYTGTSDTINVVVFGNGNYGMDENNEFVYYNACNNVTVENNVINAKGHNFIYGISIAADNSSVKNNNVTLSADYHYAAGIQVFGPSNNTVVEGNVIDVNAPDLAYGVYGYEYMAAIENIVYSDNYIQATAYGSCGMEIVSSNVTVCDNIIVLYGNYTTGIVGDIADGKILNNSIYALGSNEGTNTTGDGMVHSVSTGICVNKDNLVADNNIISSAIGIDLNDYGNSGNIVVYNNTIFVEAKGKVDNFAVYVNGIDSVRIYENNITFTGFTDGSTIYTNGLYIANTEAIVSNNTFDIEVPSVEVAWSEVPPSSGNWVSTVLSEGIVFDNVLNLVFDGNDVDLNHNFDISYGSDSIYVVDIIDSPNAVISNNDIWALGHTYIYGIHTTSEGFQIINNRVFVVSDNYCAYGINPDAGANGVVKNNTVASIGVNITYTIYSMMFGNAAEMNIDYIDNGVYGKAYVVYAYYIGGGNENIINNTIIADGNYTTCIYSTSLNNTISDNIIRSLGSCEGNMTVPYVYTYLSTAIQVINNTVISDNYIEVANGDYAIDLGNANSTVKDSYVISKKSVGKNAIINAGPDAVISNITPSLKVIIFAADLKTVYNSGDAYQVILKDENGDAVSNATIVLSGNNQTLSEKTNDKGVASFLVSGWNVGDYTVDIDFAGNGEYGPVSAQGFISISSIPPLKTILSAVDFYTTYCSGDIYYVTLKDENGVAISNATILLSGNNKNLSAITNEDGVATFLVDEWNVGGYIVNITYAGSEGYAPKAIQGFINIEPRVSEIAAPASVSVLLTAVKTGSYVTITLTDDRTNGLENKNVSVTVDGKTSYYTTDDLGVIKYKISATKAGTQTLNFVFNSDSNYVPSSAKVTVKINKEATKLTAKKKTFKAKVKTKKYTVTLKDSKKKGIKGVKITIKVGKKTYKAKTNAKGKATFKITKLNKKGTYKAKVKFAGNAYYKASSKSVKITVKK